MLRPLFHYTFFIFLTAITACASPQQQGNPAVVKVNDFETDTLPAPFTTKSTRNFSKVIGWEAGEAPKAPAGFKVSKFASGLQNPRWIYQGPNGDIFVAETNTILHGVKKFGAAISRKIKTQNLGESANRIRMFREIGRAQC